MIFSTECRNDRELLSAQKSHPLSVTTAKTTPKTGTVTKQTSNVTVTVTGDFLDPLSSSAIYANSSPISTANAAVEGKSPKVLDEYEEINRSWKSRNSSILLKYTTVKQISIVKYYCFICRILNIFKGC